MNLVMEMNEGLYIFIVKHSIDCTCNSFENTKKFAYNIYMIFRKVTHIGNGLFSSHSLSSDFYGFYTISLIPGIPK